MTAPHRSTRARPAKAPLSAEAVVTAGLRVLREEGLAAVTMRRVAAELDTGPASLYVYVAHREDLLLLLHDAVIATVPLQPVDAGRWRTQLASTITAAVHALNDHPGIGRVSLGRIPTGPAWAEMFDRILGLLLAAGLPRQKAAWNCDLIAMYIGAVAYEASIHDSPAAPPDPLQQAQDRRHADSGIEERLTALDPGRYPHLAASVTELTSGSAAERLANGIDVLITGMVGGSGG